MTEPTQRKKIGDFMVEKGLILREWVDDILDYSKANDVKFGEAAVALGLITQADLRKVLIAPYRDQSFFRLNPAYFPQVTRDLLPLEGMIEYGVLPLGYKKESHWFKTVQRLNLGVIDLARDESVKWVQDRMPSVKSIKTFQVLPDEYLTTLEKVYGVSREDLLQSERIDESLGLYLQLERRKRPRA